MHDVKFGTSGLRGLVRDLSEPVIRAYVSAFLYRLQEQGKLDKNKPLLIGYDLRPSSPQIASFVAGAVHSSGLRVENCGALPTPALALAACTRKVAAIMVTGSHIPADRNGLKFYRPDGEIDKQDELAITRSLEPLTASIKTKTVLERFPKSVKRFSDEKRDKNKKLEQFTEPSEVKSNKALQDYKIRNLSILPEGALHGLKIGIYQHSCVGQDLLEEVLTALGAQIVPFGRSDSFISVDTEALDEATKSITLQAAKENRLDAIISTDGDGDRPLIAGQDGIYLRGDSVGLLAAQFLGADCVVTPVTSSSMIESCGFFKQVYRCRVGSPYVLSTMEQAKKKGFEVIVGFEANGGLLLGSDVVLPHGQPLGALETRDALLPILAVLGLACTRKKPLHDLTENLPPRFTASNRLENVAQMTTTRFLDLLATDADCRQKFYRLFDVIHTQDQIDGLRLMFKNGDILHYRASGNAPELRCYSEASNQKRAEALVQKGLDFVRTILKL